MLTAQTLTRCRPHHQIAEWSRSRKTGFPALGLIVTTRLTAYDVGLDKNPANYAPLTPLSFLKWSARVCRIASRSCTRAADSPGQRPTRALGGWPRRSRPGE